MAMMSRKGAEKVRVFIDADVLFAGAASPRDYSASSLILLLSELTLIEAITSEQAVREAERNLQKKVPQALPVFQFLIARAVTVTSQPTRDEMYPFTGLADHKDLPILVAAIRAQCDWLVTFNLRHDRPGHPDIHVLRPGDFIRRIREQLATMQ